MKTRDFICKLWPKSNWKNVKNN